MTKRKKRLCEISVRFASALDVTPAKNNLPNFGSINTVLKLSAHQFWEVLH